MILLVLTMLLSFTGYLLPWDQLAIWAITVGSQHGQGHAVRRRRRAVQQVMTFPGTEVPMIHAGSDARFFLLAGTFVGENCAAAVLRAALRVHPGDRDRADRDPFLAHPQRRRDQRPAVSWTVIVA